MNDVRLLGIDIGTSSCKAIVIDETGRVIAEAVEKYPTHRPKPLWSEQDPADWGKAVNRCLAVVRRRLPVADSTTKTESQNPKTNLALSSQPIALALTGQMHGAVFLDKNNIVIRPAILWNDQRTTEECKDIDRIVGAERVREITMNPPLTGFQLPKILWLRKHEPEIFARVRKVLLPKDYIRFLLTGKYVTDVSDASGTGIFDVRARAWSREMMDALDLDPSIFPEVVESTTQTGEFLSHVREGTAEPALSEANVSAPHISRENGAHRGAPSHVVVFGGGGDQAAGAVGTGAVVPGIVSISLGTSGVVFESSELGARNSELNEDPSSSAFRVPSSESFHTFCHANGKWHRMGVMLSCGGALSWYAAEVRGIPVEEVLEGAETAEPGCGGLTFLPYLAGERSPHNDPMARGGFVGLTLSHGKKEMSRAVVEGVTFGLRECWEAMRSAERVARNAELTPSPGSLRSPTSPQGEGPSLSNSNNLALSPQPSALRITGGGAKSRFWVQMIADVFGVPCETLEADEGPAFGAALIAGLGAGVWPSLQEACNACVRTVERIEPSGVDYEEAYRRYKSLYQAVRPWFHASR